MPPLAPKTGDAIFASVERVNAELFTLTYGAIVRQLLTDLEEVDEVNKQLDQMGYNIGIRLVDEFLAKSNVSRCVDFKETADVIAKLGFKMFLGVTASVTNWDAEGTSCSFVLEDNPLVDFVELPDTCQGLQYCNILSGVIRGALEMGLLGAISLRRTKDTENGGKSLVGLPPKTVETCYVELSPEEREFYDQMELEAQNTMREFIDRDSVMRNYSTVLYFILRLRQICNDVALCPLDIKSWFPSNTLEDVSKNPELLKKLALLVEDGDDFDCPICLSPPTKTVITCCAHIFCQGCILKILKSPNARCPICRNPLSKEDLFLAPEVQHPDEEDSATLVSGRPLSSKVSILLKLLMESKKQDPSTKSVIFSQFQKMLILLEEPLRAAGFEISRLDGSMSAKKRSQVIKEFGHDGPGAPTVLLASLKAAGAGINLTAASRVYIVDPWWNPGVEEQAMDRVHRIGQQKEVKVVRLIVKGSIEERVLELQERKKKLVSGAFGRKAAKDNKEMRVEELRIMMRL